MPVTTKSARLSTSAQPKQRISVVTTTGQIQQFETAVRNRLRNLALEASENKENAKVCGVVYVPAATSYFYRPSLFTSNKTTITIPRGLRFVCNGRYYATEEAVTIDLSTYYDASMRAGKDLYIYGVENSNANSTTPVFVISMNSTYPDGYDANTSRKLGGFHCLCADVGTISGHDLSGYVAGDVLPLSRWDLRHRPYSSPEGMVYVEGLGLWVDIYPNSFTGGTLVSAYNGTIATGTTAKAINWYGATKYFNRLGKRLPAFVEFQHYAIGSNLQTVIAGAAVPTTAGGHVDTSSRRCVSNAGIEDCCGVIYQWGIEAGGPYTTGWASMNGTTKVPTEPCGYTYNKSCRAILGGAATIGATYCGTRCNNWSFYPDGLYNYIGVRGVSRNLGK